QDNVFFFRPSISGAVLSAGSAAGPRAAAPRGVPGVTVQLEDGSGAVLATAVTDSQGRYHFDIFTGIDGTGTYSVRLVLPAGLTQTSASPPAIQITRGDQNVTGVNFVVAPAGAKSPHGGWAASTGEATGTDLLGPAVIDALFSGAEWHGRRGG